MAGNGNVADALSLLEHLKFVFKKTNFNWLTETQQKEYLRQINQCIEIIEK